MAKSAEAPKEKEPGWSSGSPHDGKAYQDQWPANPEPKAHQAEKAAENDKAFEDMRAPFVEAQGS